MSKRKAEETKSEKNPKKAKTGKKGDEDKKEESKVDKKTWRWGILGTGKICADFTHVLQFLDDAKVVAVGSRTAESANKFGDEWKIEKRHATYEALAADPNVDIIYIGTPHNFHKDNVVLCLNNGKHVLCEKSFTVNAAEAKEIIDLARKKKLFLMEAMWTRYIPFMVKVRELLAEGTIGEVRQVQADFGFSSSIDKVQRLFDPNLCGGALLDVGIYVVSLASLAFGGGKPNKILAIADVGKTKVDEHTGMLISYGAGKMAALTCAVTLHTPREAHIIGTKGRIKLHGPFWHTTDAITLSLEGAKDKTIKFHIPKIKGKFNFGNGENMVYEAMEVHACLNAGKLESAIMPLDETLTIMETMDEVRRQVGVKYPFEK